MLTDLIKRQKAYSGLHWGILFITCNPYPDAFDCTVVYAFLSYSLDWIGIPYPNLYVSYMPLPCNSIQSLDCQHISLGNHFCDLPFEFVGFGFGSSRIRSGNIEKIFRILKFPQIFFQNMHTTTLFITCTFWMLNFHSQNGRGSGWDRVLGS